MKKEKENKIERLFKIITILSHSENHLTAEQIGYRVNKNKRTIMRDVAEIDNLFGFPILDRSNKGYKIIPVFDEPMLVTNMDDIKSLGAIKATPFGALLNTKRGSIPQQFLAQVDQLIELRCNMPDEHFKKIYNALIDGKYINLVYRKNGEDKKHQCVPLKIFFDIGQIYISVYDDDHGHIVLLAVNKIISIYKTKKKLKDDELKNLRKYVNSAWGKMTRHLERQISHAVFTISDDIAPYFLKTHLHSSQKITENKEGGYKIEVDIHNPREFTRWILRFGTHVSILGDDDVIAEMKAFLTKMHEKYS